MPGGSDAGSPVDVYAYIARFTTLGLACVETHAHPEPCAVWPGVLHQDLLGRHGCRHRVPGPNERHQEGVPLGVDFPPVSLGDRVAEEPLVFRQDLCVPAVAEAVKERGGPLDVGEEECDCPGRQAGH